MKRMVARVVAISLGLVAGSAAAGSTAFLLPPNGVQACLLLAKERLFPSDDTRLDEEGPVRNRRILQEITELGEHAWAGVYQKAGESPDELALSPREGFTLHEGSWCGTCAHYSAVGRVLTVRGSVLELAVELAASCGEPREFGLDGTCRLHLSRWGELLFAVPEARMELFCAEVSDGASFPSVPFRTIGGAREVDPVKPSRPTGQAQVPSAFQHLLVDRPISGTIRALDAWERRPELDGEDNLAHDVMYTLDAGSDDGLAAGMRLFVEGGSSTVDFRARVEQVEARKSRIRLLVFEDRRAWAEGLVGTRATTQAPRGGD